MDKCVDLGKLTKTPSKKYSTVKMCVYYKKSHILLASHPIVTLAKFTYMTIPENGHNKIKVREINIVFVQEYAAASVLGEFHFPQ